MSQLLSASQAAELLGVSHGLVRRLLLQGRLKGQKAGQGWVIYRSEVERFAAKARPEGRPRSRKKA